VPGASAPSAITASLYFFTAESSNFTHNNRRRTIIFSVMWASGPITKYDIGVVGLAIIIYASTLRSKT
jgi:hypothetical protein